MFNEKELRTLRTLLERVFARDHEDQIIQLIAKIDHELTKRRKHGHK